jgi:hypothetical protein
VRHAKCLSTRSATPHVGCLRAVTHIKALICRCALTLQLCAGHDRLSKRDELLQKVLVALPDKFAALPETTTRKAAKDETEGTKFFFGAKAVDLQKLKADGAVLSWRQQGADIYCCTMEAAQAMYKHSGKLALLAVSDAAALAMVQSGLPPSLLVVHVRPMAHLSTAPATATSTLIF